MPSTLELCEKYFETRDVYKVFDLNKDSLEKNIKKAYYKLSLKVHPDRVPESEKGIATEKFKVLSLLHQVLTDPEKKKLYDQHGIIDDEDDGGKLTNWLEIWRKIFKPISVEDIENYQKSYVDSELEKTDIKKAYLNGKGCINYMMSSVPFMGVEDEPRIHKIVMEWIASKEVPEYKIFTDEPKAKRLRRHKKYARESKEAKEMKAKMESNDSLEIEIRKRQKNRSERMDSFLDNLMNAYTEEDNSDVYEATDLPKFVEKSKKKSTKTKISKSETTKTPERKVKGGRVSKRIAEKVNK